MLFLQPAANGSASDAPPRLSVNDEAGLRLERALLAADHSVCIAEVEAALAAERNLANWAIAAAELRLGRTVNRLDEAAAWLADRLVVELAPVLEGDDSEGDFSGVGWRLPALLKTLAQVHQHLADFDRRLEREKLDAMKELAYGASHEINNPLANIAARAQTLLEDEQDPQRRQKLTAMHRQAMRAHEMISDLMLYARPPKLRYAAFDLVALVQKLMEQLSPLAEENQILLQLAAADDLPPIQADETQVGVAIHAVLKNAIEAVDQNGQVTIAVGESKVGGERWMKIAVTDDGPGISAEVRRHIFDPFFSGREAGRGLGFGLSKCWRIVTDHGGQVLAESRACGGAEITILLPVIGTTANE